MKILFVLEYYYPHIGGVESLFKALIDQLDSEGHQVTILTNRYDPSLLAVEQQGNVTIRRYNFRNRYFFTFLAWLPAIRLARDVDLIHTTSYNAGIPAWIAAKLRSKPVLITFHEYWGELWDELPWMSGFARRLHSAFEKMLVRLSFDRFIGVSDFTAERLITSAKIPANRVGRVYNGIDYTEHWPSWSADNELFTFTYFGRIGYSKGLDLLVSAISILKEQKVKCILQLVVPQEGLYDLLMKLIEEADVADYIRFYHELPYEELQDLIAGSDAVVIPSYSEGFCYAAVETMAIGTPIISSGRGALGEVINGRYIEMSEHTAQALADAMQQAIAGEWDEKEPRKYPLSDTITAYINEYEHILSAE